MAFTLPAGWASDYDGAAERWFFVHRPSGFTQSQFPKPGDELLKPAELAQPQPKPPVAIDVLSEKIDAMAISLEQDQSTVTLNQHAQSNPQYQAFWTAVPPTEQPLQPKPHNWQDSVQPQIITPTYSPAAPSSYQQRNANAQQVPDQPVQTQYTMYQSQNFSPGQPAPVNTRPVSGMQQYTPYSAKPQANQVIRRKPTNASQVPRKGVSSGVGASCPTAPTAQPHINPPQQQNWQPQPTKFSSGNAPYSQLPSQRFAAQQMHNQSVVPEARGQSGQCQQSQPEQSIQSLPPAAAYYSNQQVSPKPHPIDHVGAQYQAYHTDHQPAQVVAQVAENSNPLTQYQYDLQGYPLSSHVNTQQDAREQVPDQELSQVHRLSISQASPGSQFPVDSTAQVFNQQAVGSQVLAPPGPSKSPISIASTSTQESQNLSGNAPQVQQDLHNRRFSTVSGSSRMSTHSPINTPSPIQPGFSLPPPPSAVSEQRRILEHAGFPSQPPNVQSQPMPSPAPNGQTSQTPATVQTLPQFIPPTAQNIASPHIMQSPYQAPSPSTPQIIGAPGSNIPQQPQSQFIQSAQNIQAGNNPANSQSLQPQLLPPPPPPITHSQPQSPLYSTPSPFQGQFGTHLYRPQSGPASSTFAQLVQQDYINTNSPPPQQPVQSYNPLAMGAMTAPTAPDPNRIQPYQAQFAGPPPNPGSLPELGSTRPGLATRWTTTALKSSQKGLEKGKAWMKKNPMGSMAMAAGGLGVLAEVAGVPVLSEAAAVGRGINSYQANKIRQEQLAMQAGRGRGRGMGVGVQGGQPMGQAAIQAAIQQGIQDGIKQAMLAQAQQGGMQQQIGAGRGMTIQQQQMNVPYQQALLNALQLQQQGRPQSQYMSPGVQNQALGQQNHVQGLGHQMAMQQFAAQNTAQQPVAHSQSSPQPNQSQQHGPLALHQIDQIASMIPQHPPQHQSQVNHQQSPSAQPTQSQQHIPSTLHQISQIANMIPQHQIPQPQANHQSSSPTHAIQAQHEPSILNQIANTIPHHQLQHQPQAIHQQSPEPQVMQTQHQEPSSLSEIANVISHHQSQQQQHQQPQIIYQQSPPTQMTPTQAQEPSIIDQLSQIANMIPQNHNQQQPQVIYQQIPPQVAQTQEPSTLSQLSQLANMLPNQNQNQQQPQIQYISSPPPQTAQSQDPSMISQLSQFANMMPNQNQNQQQQAPTQYLPSPPPLQSNQPQDPSMLSQLSQLANMMPNQNQNQQQPQTQTQYLPNSPPAQPQQDSSFLSHLASQSSQAQAQSQLQPQTQTQDQTIQTFSPSPQDSGTQAFSPQSQEPNTQVPDPTAGYDPATGYTDISTLLADAQANGTAQFNAALQEQLALQSNNTSFNTALQEQLAAQGNASIQFNTALQEQLALQSQGNGNSGSEAQLIAAIQAASQTQTDQNILSLWDAPGTMYTYEQQIAAIQEQGTRNLMASYGVPMSTTTNYDIYTDGGSGARYNESTAATQARLDMQLQGEANAMSLIDDTQYTVTSSGGGWDPSYGGDATAARLDMQMQGEANAMSLIDDTQYEVTYGGEDGFVNELV